MLGITGKVTLKAEIRHTEYYFGDVSEIAGAMLDLIEQNEEGWCLCLFGDKGMVDVHPDDIKSIEQLPFTDDMFALNIAQIMALLQTS